MTNQHQGHPQKTTLYLPGLHGLRFLAAFSVFFGHLEQAKEWVKIPAFQFPFNPSMPADGVTLFFVLSGFLITYLLLIEKSTYGSIQIKQFYRRRILRLWPLYYLWVALVFFVFPHIPQLSFPNLDNSVEGDFWKRLLLFVFLSPHIAILIYTQPGVAGPLWSVGVEEYFYFIWPHLIKRLKALLPFAMVFLIVAPIFLRIEGAPFFPHPFVRALFHLFRIDCMVIGGLGAWIYLNHRKWLMWVFSWPVQVMTWIWAIRQLLYPTQYGMWEHTTYSLVFLSVILNVSLNPRSLVKLENKFFKFMGEISYGFYVFQWFCNVVTIKIFERYFSFRNDTLQSVCLLVANFIFTTLLSALSYYLWEKRFLILKQKKYSVIEVRS